MRLISIVAIGLLSLSVIGSVGCTKASPPAQAITTTAISVDMPRDQTIQFLKQSATTLKLSRTTTATNDSITAGSTTAALSGPDAGPVTVEFKGESAAVSKWSAMVMEKLPSKKL